MVALSRDYFPAGKCRLEQWIAEEASEEQLRRTRRRLAELVGMIDARLDEPPRIPDRDWGLSATGIGLALAVVIFWAYAITGFAHGLRSIFDALR